MELKNDLPSLSFPGNVEFLTVQANLSITKPRKNEIKFADYDKKSYNYCTTTATIIVARDNLVSFYYTILLTFPMNKTVL